MIEIDLCISPSDVPLTVESSSYAMTVESPIVIQETPVPAYEGQTEVTPSAETQVLQTQGDLMLSNITINPIPSNYGLITWDGATLTVS